MGEIDPTRKAIERLERVRVAAANLIRYYDEIEELRMSNDPEDRQVAIELGTDGGEMEDQLSAALAACGKEGQPPNGQD